MNKNLFFDHKMTGYIQNKRFTFPVPSSFCAEQHAGPPPFGPLVFRDMGMSDPKILLSMGTFLIAATVGVFVIAFWRVRAELKLLQSEQKANGGEDNSLPVGRLASSQEGRERGAGATPEGALS